MTVLNLQVNASGNDSGTTLLAFAFSNTETASGVGNVSGQSRELYTRFTSVTVPQGTVATSAILSLYNAGYTTSQTTRIKSKAENADNPAAPTSGSDVNGRTYTGGTAWADIVSAADPSWQTVDVVSDCNTVFARGGFSSGNNLGIRTIDNGGGGNGYLFVKNYDGDTTKAAKLDITYSAGGTTYNESMSGGISLGGGATYFLRAVPSVGGSLTLGGSSSPALVANPSPSGGLTLAGSANVFTTASLTGSGTLTLGGNVLPMLLANPATGGGVALAGSAAVYASANLTTSGGPSLGGSASPVLTANLATSGEFALGGSAAVAGTANLTAAGGLSLDGFASVWTAASLSPSGGVSLSGAAEISGVYTLSTSGGLELGGSASAVFIIVTPPWLIAASDAFQPGPLASDAFESSRAHDSFQPGTLAWDAPARLCQGAHSR